MKALLFHANGDSDWLDEDPGTPWLMRPTVEPTPPPSEWGRGDEGPRDFNARYYERHTYCLGEVFGGALIAIYVETDSDLDAAEQELWIRLAEGGRMAP